MAEHVYLLTLFLPLATALLIFGMKYYAAVQQAKARLASDEAYRQVAEQAAAAQAETAATLAAMNATLGDVKARLAVVEKILREVE
jgi:Tfp pilus assembly protein PilO